MIGSVNFFHNIIVLDKINQWGSDFRDAYTRLGLLKPFLAEDAAIYFLTGTATANDIKVSKISDIQ